MTTYVYKSSTGHPVNIGTYVVTPTYGVQSSNQISILDEYIGISIDRYDDGVLAILDNYVEVRGINNSAGKVNTLSFNNTPFSVSRTLLNYTGANVLTGGTSNTKTLLLEVPLPNGWALDYKAGLRISAYFGFSLNANSKSYGIDFGTSFGSAINLWSRTRSLATQGLESTLIDLQRSPLNRDQYIRGYGGNMSTEGVGATNTSSYNTSLSTAPSPETNGTSIFFWGTLVTSNADQVTLARAKVDLCVAEY